MRPLPPRRPQILRQFSARPAPHRNSKPHIERRFTVNRNRVRASRVLSAKDLTDGQDAVKARRRCPFLRSCSPALHDKRPSAPCGASEQAVEIFVHIRARRGNRAGTFDRTPLRAGLALEARRLLLHSGTFQSWMDARNVQRARVGLAARVRASRTAGRQVDGLMIAAVEG